MIVTLTCNPAIDKTVSKNETLFSIGGKGINVAKVLKVLGEEPLCTGFLGKENGKIITDGLEELKIANHFIEVDGKVRTNTKIIENDQLTERNEKGPDVSEKNVRQLLDCLSQFHDDIIVISGSAPKNLKTDFYGKIIDLLKQNNNKVILDCDGEMFARALAYRPDVIKPNEDEICRYLGIEYNRKRIIEECAKMDIPMICISLGAEGSIFIDGDDVYEVRPQKVEYASAVGAGDAMVAAMAYGMAHSLDLLEMIQLASACASASVETRGTETPAYERIMRHLKNTEVNKYE